MLFVPGNMFGKMPACFLYFSILVFIRILLTSAILSSRIFTHSYKCQSHCQFDENQTLIFFESNFFFCFLNPSNIHVQSQGNKNRHLHISYLPLIQLMKEKNIHIFPSPSRLIDGGDGKKTFRDRS